MSNPPSDPPAATVAKLPLVEEVASVATEEHVTGRVRVSTTVETVEQLVRASLESQAVDVTRVPVDRVVDIAPQVRTEGDVTIVPILEEILVVEKRLVLKEELHIRRIVSSDTVEQPISLRRQRAVVERFDADGDPEPQSRP